VCPEALGSLTRPGPITNINTDLVFRVRLETESMRIPYSIITTAIMIIIIRNVTAAHLRCSFCDQPRIFLKYCGCVYVCRKQRKNNSQGRSTHDASSRQVPPPAQFRAKNVQSQRRRRNYSKFKSAACANTRAAKHPHLRPAHPCLRLFGRAPRGLTLIASALSRTGDLET
jgi:hypothetical protein